MEVAALRWVSPLEAPGWLLSGSLLGALCSWFGEVPLCGKKQVFCVKTCACFAQNHILSFFQATVSCTVSAGVGGMLKSSKSAKQIHLGWDFPVSLELWTLRPTGQGFGSGADAESPGGV